VGVGAGRIGVGSGCAQAAINGIANNTRARQIKLNKVNILFISNYNLLKI